MNVTIFIRHVRNLRNGCYANNYTNANDYIKVSFLTLVLLNKVLSIVFIPLEIFLIIFGFDAQGFDVLNNHVEMVCMCVLRVCSM